MSNFLNSIKLPVIILVVFFVLLYGFVKIFGPIPFSINSVTTTKSDLFQVSGTGEVSEAPDSAEVDFGVTKSATTISDAQNQTNTNVDSLLKALKNLGVGDKDIKTTSYNVNPNYDFRSGSQTINGYTVSQSIQLTVKSLDKLNNILDTLTANGANLINQVSFTFSDAKKQQLEDKARQLAVEEAKTKAQSLANASGMHLGRIVNVTEENSIVPRPVMPLAMAKDQAAESAPTQVTPGENSISLTVTLSYETY
ncbi:MAG TPA: SIMPL domain-containing protein [Patescibacteria group bacterium]